jgi:hypothetical protein
LSRGLDQPPKPVADLDRVDQIGDAALPGDVADVLARDEPGAGSPRLMAPEGTGPNSFLLDDVARGLVGLAAAQALDRVLEAVPSHQAG